MKEQLQEVLENLPYTFLKSKLSPMFNYKRSKTNVFIQVYTEINSLVIDNCVLSISFRKATISYQVVLQLIILLFKNNLVNIMCKN